MTCAFRVVMKTFPSATATPRLTLPQQSDTSNGDACRYRHSSAPVAASSAQHWPSHPETYMTPSTTSGEASHAYVVAPERKPRLPAWNTHCGVILPTLLALIWSSGL